MSLFKQISILLCVIFTLLLILILSISFNEIKDSAQKSLYENVQNSVSNISLSITNANADESTIKTVLNASFDNGNYEKIVFKDLDEKIVYERTKEEEHIESRVPKWFLNIVEIKEVSSSSTVSQGWSVLGTLEVYANREVFYTQMYKIFSSLTITLILTFIVVLFFLSFLFKSILKPLDMIKKQSESIMENKFIFQEKIPFTLEFKSLTISINSMVEKIQNMFNHANEILKKNKELLYIDELTKLYNRKYLVLKTSEYLEENSVNHKGYIVSVVLTRVDILNKKIGYEKADELFVNMSTVLKNLCLTKEMNFISRTNAAEFIAVLPRTYETQAQELAKKINEELSIIVNNIIIDDEVKLFIGLCTFGNEKNHMELLSKIDYSLLQSKTFCTGKNYYYLEDSQASAPKKDFRKIIKKAIETNSFKILFRDVLSLKTKKISYQTISFQIETEKKTYFYGEFIPAAIELELLNEVYLSVIEKVVTTISLDEKVSIQIPSEFIQNVPFTKLKKILDKKRVGSKIIFELEEEAFSKYSLNSLAFINLIEEYIFDFAVFNFMGISDDYSYLKAKKPEYIKMNQSFLEADENFDALNMLNMSLGIRLIATSINSQEELKTLEDKEIDLIAGQITQNLK